jgi:hydrogenase expression/formation protein HypD
MKYIEGFRNPQAAAAIVQNIKSLASNPSMRPGKISIMEVCGSHTMAIARYGIRSLLPDNIDLISGPGCPVCVTPCGYIDTAVKLALQGAIIVTFGDMLNVPGSTTNLSECRSAGGKIEVCYSPVTAIEQAMLHPDQEVVFLAIGFETTIAPVVSVIDSANRQGLTNLSFLTSFKLIPPALHALINDRDLCVDAFLCPAHVSAIIGSNAYKHCAIMGKACVIAGFEPLDILYGIQGILTQLLNRKPTVENQYNRVVRPQGNEKAMALMDRYLQPAEALWRGMGLLPASGLTLRPEYSNFDALKRRKMEMIDGIEPKGCLCGDVIKGKSKPIDCPLFSTACTTDHPVGPCMVSSEGTCSAYYKYSIINSALTIGNRYKSKN